MNEFEDQVPDTEFKDIYYWYENSDGAGYGIDSISNNESKVTSIEAFIEW